MEKDSEEHDYWNTLLLLGNFLVAILQWSYSVSDDLKYLRLKLGVYLKLFFVQILIKFAISHKAHMY